ncbi:Oidioi.mRNA.OKI2018_I69.XSR.g15400.t2.cds [Oikopleura dioica]|uniref:non-specific serine/threonine protein kinase n=1 Tax=Oikopleura dioica TaxID=34765 RepID=A0ABN7SEM3_OIKDI|nr:Oidioi.mRNA.OKI2018_I69.XSR.g15400.t2.cds [Oikopleura dioica]
MLKFIVSLVLALLSAGDLADDYDDESGDEWLSLPELSPSSLSGPLLLQTIDGRLHAVDPLDGSTKWDTVIKRDWFPQYKEPNADNFDLSFVPDPSDGSIYYFDRSETDYGEQAELRKMGMTIQEMIESSPTKAEDGKLYVGDKKDNWQILDSTTGDVIQKIDQGGGESKIPTPIPLHHEKLFVGYTVYSLTIFDSNTNEVKWNLTYSELAAKELELSNPQIRIEVCSNCGTIVAKNFLDNTIKWQANFGYPIIGAYNIYNGGLFKFPFQSFDSGYFEPFRPKDTRSLQVYVGLYGKKLYVLNSMAPNYMMLPEMPSSTDSGTNPLGYYPLPVTDLKPTKYASDGVRLLPGKSTDVCGSPDESSGPNLNNNPGSESLTNCPAPSQIPGRDLPGASASDRKDAAVQVEVLPNSDNNLLESEHMGIFARLQGIGSKSESKFLTAIDITRETLSNVHVLQALVLLLFLILIVQFSWRNIFPKAPHSIGKISFDPSEFLGKGCMGTSVFRGSFDGRDVAVKRLLVDSYQLADREIDLLRQADHPNLLRYFCSEKDRQFIYIALELCQGDLDFYVQNQHTFESDLPRDEILKHCCAGVEQLHSLGVIHRDIKPSNILITYGNRHRCRRAVIADFGLSRQVNPGRHSISVTDLHGTEGWAAPEVFQCDVSKITYSVDIFSLGCVFYFVLSDGKHPYGHEFFMRQARIRQGKHDLKGISSLHENLILNMIQPDPQHRLPMKGVQEHPIFWNSDKKIRFLALTSDRLSQNPQEQKNIENFEMTKYLEMNSERIAGSDWRLRLESELQEDLRKFRNYNDGIRDLLRALRNKRHHFRDLTCEAREILGETSESFFHYWSRAFPNLLRITYEAVSLDYEKTNDPFFSIFFDQSYCSVLAANVRRVAYETQPELTSRYFNKSTAIQNAENNEVLLTNSPIVQAVPKEFDINQKDNQSEREPEIITPSKENDDREASKLQPALKSTNLTNKSAGESPKMIPYSHKIKTKLIFQERSPKRIRYRPNDEDSSCLMLDGSTRTIHRDVPIRSEPEIIESDRRESERVRLAKEGFKISKSGSSAPDTRNSFSNEAADDSFSNRFHGLSDNDYSNLEPRIIPELLPQFPLQALPEIISNSTAGNLIQRGISFVRQLSTSSDTADSSNVGRKICEELLLDDDEDSDNENIPGSDEEIIFGPIGTPKSSRVIAKKQSPVNRFGPEFDDYDDSRCLITPESVSDSESKMPFEDASNNKKTSNRRKRPTKKKKRR